jgi:uncharacterized sporulation protein YeaH/YhbH (DUF444 family)
VKEYRFVYGENAAASAPATARPSPARSWARPGSKGQPGQGPAGSDPGLDYYETEITLDELVDIMFEDLELPDLERKS